MSDEPLADISIGADYEKKSGRRVQKVQPAPNPFRARRRIVLVHGFNSSPEVSAKGYDSLRAEIRAIAPKLDWDIKTLTWPGRVRYWAAVVRAKDPIAVVLADFLSRSARRSPRQLVFVAHSLGCRLVLEALHHLPPAARADILPRTRLVLLAAAVPTRTVAIGGHLRSTVDECARAEIYYSFTDQALGVVFTLGELGEGGITQAVGLAGQPAELWQNRRYNMTPFFHGDYWKSEIVAYRLALALRAVKNRPQWRLALKHRAPVGRAPPSRDLNRRDLESRRV